MSDFVRLLRVVAGVPIEIAARILRRRWVLDETITHVFPDGRTLTAYQGLMYDKFTFAPNLRRADGKPSRASAIHDQGWFTGRTDDGSILTFDENNQAFRRTLDLERHYEWVKDLYEWGVSLSFMRKLWVEHFGHA